MGKNSVVADVVTGDPLGGGRRSANAAQRSALAAQDVANANYQTTSDIMRTATTRASRSMNNATIEGLNSLDRDIANQEKNLARQEQLISQLDPTIIEASQQALKLLRGEESSTLAPLKRQRDQQRQKLLNSLREQLGPGAETSTAGIQALTRFDSETDSLFSGAQQQALQGLGSLSSQFTSQRPDMLREISGLSNFGQQQYGLRANSAQFNLNAQSNLASMLSNARAGVQQTAGAGNVANLLQGQQQYAFGNQLIGAGLQAGTGALTSGMGGGGGKATPTSTYGAQAGGSYLNTGAYA